MDAQTELSNTTVRRKKCRKKIRQTENWLFFREVRAMRTLQRRWWGKLLNSSIVSGKTSNPPPPQLLFYQFYPCHMSHCNLARLHLLQKPCWVDSTPWAVQTGQYSTYWPTRIMQFFWVGFTVNKNLHTLVRKSLPLHYKKI